MARGLFARAILQSPGIPTARASVLPMRSLDVAEKSAREYALAHDIEGSGAAALAALRALPADTLVAGMKTIVSGPEIFGSSRSIVDGKLVVEAPESALVAGRQAPVPVIVGANDYDSAVSTAQSRDELFAMFGSFQEQARKFYEPSGAATLASVEQNIVADRSLIEPARHLADLVTAAGKRAYFYRFSYVPEALRANVPGATHASEIPFTLDVLDVLLGEKATAADRAVARGASGYWVQFVKTGDPNGGGRPKWPSYDAGRRNVLNFTNTGVRYGADPVRARLDLWNAVWERGIVVTPGN
jgi:para-nitrobenzyl esterase